MSRQQQQQQQQLIEGLDAYLQRVGKDLPVGSKVRLRLVQGPLPISSIDPVERTAGATANIPKQSFPSILKFPPSSTQPPNFTQAPWHTGQGRVHIENVPKPQEDSDDEDNGNKSSQSGGASDMNNSNIGGGEGGMTSSNTSTKPTVGKKRWKYNRNVTPAKQWIVQDQVDFLETMVYRRKQLKYQKLVAQYRKRRMTHPNEAIPPLPPAPVPPPVRSTRYVGQPERMTSHHVLFTLQPPKIGYHRDHDMDDDDDDEDRNTATITVRTLPPMEQPIMVPMTQPAVRSHSAFSTLSNAAQVMEDQRFAMSSTAASLAFRNARPKLGNDTNNNHGSSNNSDGTTLRVGGIRKINKTQSRLLQKLQQKEKISKSGAEEEDGDDVMADVAYKERKGSSGGARRELLSTLGDGLKVSDDGVVLGGTNDALFGGRGLKFNRFAVQADATTSASNDNKTERGADGAAMSDDFYTRDVGAEYEEMDYDAAEQFDDDDVDVGETEMQNVGNDGYNEDEDDDDNDDDSDDMNDDDDDAIGGAEGLASMAGYKALLAKARGEIQAVATTEKGEDSRASSPTNVNSSGVTGGVASSTTTASMKNGDETNMKRSVSPKPDKGRNMDDSNKPMDHLAKKMAAAEKTAQVLKEKQQQKPKDATSASSTSAGGAANGTTNNPNTTAARNAAAAPQVDEHGLRLITLDAVRKEIWLNHGSIPINRLIKIFNANKKHGEVRQNQLKEVIKELCTMTNDPIHGRVLVLKQHYSHMS